MKLLQKNLLEKIAGSGQFSIQDPHILFEEVFPIEEGSLVAAFFYRYFMEEEYPKLRTLLNPTKKMIVKLIAHAQAVADGNFQYLDELTESVDQSAPDETESPTSGEIASQFFELVIQMAANMIDPTWKTPWFLPGPLMCVRINKQNYGIDIIANFIIKISFNF